MGWGWEGDGHRYVVLASGEEMLILLGKILFRSLNFGVDFLFSSPLNQKLFRTVACASLCLGPRRGDLRLGALVARNQEGRCQNHRNLAVTGSKEADYQDSPSTLVGRRAALCFKHCLPQTGLTIFSPQDTGKFLLVSNGMGMYTLV